MLSFRYDDERKFKRALAQSIEKQNQFKGFLQQVETELKSRDKANQQIRCKGRSLQDILTNHTDEAVVPQLDEEGTTIKEKLKHTIRVFITW